MFRLITTATGLLASLCAFSGSGSASDDNLSNTYLLAGGGYFKGEFYSQFTRYTANALTEQSTFNNQYSHYYVQIGAGSDFYWGSLPLSHQIVVSKLTDSVQFNTASSTFKLRQDIDFGYDLMPHLPLAESISAFGILGVHYARFSFQKSSSSSTNFDVGSNQLGFNLGAGLRYYWGPRCALEVKYQHWQYASTDISATVQRGSRLTVDHNPYSPSYNMIGLQINYYI